MILIAESGSTKCDWVLLDTKGREIDRWNTMGLNPFFHTSEMVHDVLKHNNGLRLWADKIHQTYFYGAGCSAPHLKETIKKGLDLFFNNALNNVGHDLEAAAFALYNGEPEVACILGTGSNSCFFDGKHVSEKVPALGYILGDEGSASYIGKRLITDYLYQRLPKELQCEFESMYGLTKDDILNRVYNQDHANVYLASFGPFAGKHAGHPYIQKLVKEGFMKFIEIHVACFSEANKVPISFVGSVAKVFEDLLTECIDHFGFKKGKILAKPVNHLVQYHIDFLKVLENQPKV